VPSVCSSCSRLTRAATSRFNLRTRSGANRAATRAERAELSLSRLDYLLAAQHFKSLPLTEWTEVFGSDGSNGFGFFSIEDGLFGLRE
jgi:hypothetical protein